MGRFYGHSRAMRGMRARAERRMLAGRAVMPTKRDVLSLFSRGELLAVVDRFELPVADRRVKDQLLEAIAPSKKASVDEAPADCARDGMKELCRALGHRPRSRTAFVAAETLEAERESLKEVVLTKRAWRRPSVG
jgi:hypothetical protein